MHLCSNSEQCPFFSSHSVYSPDLQRTMKEHFCREDNPACARKRAIQLLGADRVPDDLLPTDHERIARLVAQ